MKNKVIGVIGTDGYVSAGWAKSNKELLKALGENSGNLVFQYAFCRSLSSKYLIIGRDIIWNDALIRKECDYIAIPAANFIRSGFDLTALTQFIENIKLPLIVVGLGAQAETLSSKVGELHSSVKRFLSVIKERVHTIGVRGDFTANQLEDFGISNYSIIGCPSNFINLDADLGVRLQGKFVQPKEAFQFIGDEVSGKEEVIACNRRLALLAYQKGGVYIQQAKEYFLNAYRRKNPYSLNSGNVNQLHKFMLPDISFKEFKKFLLTQTRTYLCVEQWLEDTSRFDLSIGCRIHGSMVALQATCPAVLITHDSRTSELAETLALPNISRCQFNTIKTIDEIITNVSPDFTKYTQRRSELLNKYNKILTSFEQNKLILKSRNYE